MTRTYYVVESNDGSPQSKELDTLKQARAELKSIIVEDRTLGLGEGDIDYYIMKYTEMDNELTYEVVK